MVYNSVGGCHLEGTIVPTAMSRLHRSSVVYHNTCVFIPSLLDINLHISVYTVIRISVCTCTSAGGGHTGGRSDEHRIQVLFILFS